MMAQTSKINAEWHSKHKMPHNPTLDQRIKWHVAHARNCSCRPIPGTLLDEFQRRYTNTHQEFWIYFSRDDHFALARWTAGCAERVLPYFEADYPQDARPHQAILTLRTWIDSGQFSLREIRGASLAAHAAARAVQPANLAACYAARAAGQAVATAHVPTHALGSALYAIKAIAASHPSDVNSAVAEERDWQLQRLAENLRPWVLAGLMHNQRLLPKNLRL